MSIELIPLERRQIIRHALTGGTAHVYRRHYVVVRGSETHLTLQGMVDDGLMTGPVEGDMMISFLVTEAGAAAIGLHLPQDHNEHRAYCFCSRCFVQQSVGNIRR